ncbi:orotidine-5'-phosphate decarboxylase [Rhizobium sullae]|uniref:orotidine-5'-phosphate decarboxylase n=1 Tax=Rhizobium sullae TaxID=50338 RepID=UPI000B353771|nr:orotidine-5'-phosphate decarboxylase [Rhizobium sullae]
MATFVDKFFMLADQRSPLCLGLDPSSDLLHSWGLDDTVDGLRQFCDVVLEAAGDRVAVVKPQSGFFERFGPVGMTVMMDVIKAWRERGTLCLIDCKRGDVATTMEGYATAMLGRDSAFGGDAMTVTAYLGFNALRPVFKRAFSSDTSIFVVVHSSNPEGRFLQHARHEDGTAVADRLADEITRANADYGQPIGPICAVVGATIDGSDTGLLDRLPTSLLLAPGVGVQGAALAETKQRFGSAYRRALPSVSRAILQKGPDVSRLRSEINRFLADARHGTP